ncbi:hypothetical protein FAM23853_000629 [Propionibacterium freudenreichii]|uniref:hypothetical protein n=1 Tax=Propionibacterium freudenreichii TaxID=1744 RepID=UPI00254E4E70|nr:hypothetical protein [Propionibacterium freudenreichii]MDK9339407.1 hypothetical protein [Propionibacterium freudenreichii]
MVTHILPGGLRYLTRSQPPGEVHLAARRGLITAPSAEVLRSVYLYGLSGREAAGRHEMSEDMVRYRCSSSVKRLRRHMSDLAG